jgi:hypothetical protein
MATIGKNIWFIGIVPVTSVDRSVPRGFSWRVFGNRFTRAGGYRRAAAVGVIQVMRALVCGRVP